MSKWLEKFNKSNRSRIQKRIDKLNEEYNEFRLNYKDFPYDRYLKAMNVREKEIEELQGITGTYECIIDEEFKHRADHGIW